MYFEVYSTLIIFQKVENNPPRGFQKNNNHMSTLLVEAARRWELRIKGKYQNTPAPKGIHGIWRVGELKRKMAALPPTPNQRRLVDNDEQRPHSTIWTINENYGRH